MMDGSYWEKQELVARFAGRDPDARLLELLDDYPLAERTRVLDLGCGGGRNSAVLAREGFDLYALDASRAMVAHTRRRLRPFLGKWQADRRVKHISMSDLGEFQDASFDLVVALGVYHCAISRDEWARALSETSRVLTEGGRLLVSVFTPETDLTGNGVRPVQGEMHLYDGLPAGRYFLVDRETLDTEMRRFGLTAEFLAKTVRHETEMGRRVVVNALYVKTE